jgi:hypothetical protein
MSRLSERRSADFMPLATGSDEDSLVRQLRLVLRITTRSAGFFSELVLEPAKPSSVRDRLADRSVPRYRPSTRQLMGSV